MVGGPIRGDAFGNVPARPGQLLQQRGGARWKTIRRILHNRHIRKEQSLRPCSLSGLRGAIFQGEAPLRKPTVLLNRERFGRRHLNAYFLGEFFRAIYQPTEHVGAMRAFNRIGWLCGQPMIPVVRPAEPRPERLAQISYEHLRKNDMWWEDGLSVAQQFESFLSIPPQQS